MIIRDGRIDITGDSGWLIDFVVPATDYRRGPTGDSVGVSGDTAVRGLLAGRGSSDAIGASDATGRIHEAHRPVSDVPVATDGVLTDLSA